MWVGQATSDRVYLEGSSSETNPVPYLFAVPVPAARVRYLLEVATWL